MTLYIFMVSSVLLSLGYLMLSVRPTAKEWLFYIFVLGLAAMPGRIRNMPLFTSQAVSNDVVFIYFFLTVFAVYRILLRWRIRPGTVGVATSLFFLCAWALVTSQGVVGHLPSGNPFWLALTALGKWVPGFLACLLGISILPGTHSCFKRLETYYLVVSGFVVAPQLILTALNLGSWDTYASDDCAGFLRGWSTLGSGITTGWFLCPALFLALRRILLKQRNAMVFLVTGTILVACLFTLSRSVMLLLVVGVLLTVLHYSRLSLVRAALTI
jgi:hypothetical protein